jgi:hypothetical protein
MFNEACNLCLISDPVLEIDTFTPLSSSVGGGRVVYASNPISGACLGGFLWTMDPAESVVLE